MTHKYLYWRKCECNAQKAAALNYFQEDREMLVLSRKRGESVVIDESVIITVLDVRGDRVKLGFDAPPETSIAREEIRRPMERSHARSAHDARYPLVSRNSEQS